MSDTKAVKKLKSMVEGESKTESIASLAKKLGIARGTLNSLMAGTTLPRLDVINAAKKVGIKQEDWS
jgi:hypothetical protein